MSFNSFNDTFRFRYTKGAKLVGKYQFAQLAPDYYPLPNNMICFNERSSIKNDLDCGLHCFISDRHFECLWSNCDHYINKLQGFRLVIGPDFSLYRDMEDWRRIYNCGRNNAICFYLAKHGVRIIPVASWAFLADLDWSLSGFQKGCTLAVSSNGCLLDPSNRKIFTAGISIIQRELEPRTLYVCGDMLPELSNYNNIQYFKSFAGRKFAEEK